MQTQNNLPIQKKQIINKLQHYPKLHNITSSLYSIYCSLTGFLHVLPDFYLIGVQKSGTTALFDYISQHPSVPKEITKDIRFFDKYYHKGINWYKVNFPLKSQKFFSSKINHQKFMIGDGTERYFDYPHTPKRIKLISPNAMFILVLRNPVDRTYSHYNFNVKRGIENRSLKDSIEDEKKIIKLEFEKMLNNPNYYSDNYFRYSYIDRSKYAKKLKHWLKVFPKEQFLIIQSEKFFEDPSKVYQQVLKFLNLSNWDLKKYEKIGATPYKKSKIDSTLRKELVDYFKPFNEQLFELLGERFDWN